MLILTLLLKYKLIFPSFLNGEKMNKQALSSVDLTPIMLKTPLDSSLFQVEPAPLSLCALFPSQSQAAPRNQKTLKTMKNVLFSEKQNNQHFTNKNQKVSVIRNQWRILTWIFFFNRGNKTKETKSRKSKTPVIGSLNAWTSQHLSDRRNSAGLAF